MRAVVRRLSSIALASIALASIALARGEDVPGHIASRRARASEREMYDVKIAQYAKCDAQFLGTQCFEGAIEEDDGDGECAPRAGTVSVWRVRADAERLDDACWSVDTSGMRALVRLNQYVSACNIVEGDIFRIEGVYSCTREGRLFPYSTLLLGEVVALADSAIYLAEAVNNLGGTQSEEGGDRAGTFTIKFPASF